MKISIVAAENKATDILVTVLKYTISHQITVQKSQMPTEKSSGQLSTGMKAHGKPWCYKRESLKSIMPGHSDWEQGLWGLQPEGFERHFCFCSTFQPLSCPRSFHSSGGDGLCQQPSNSWLLYTAQGLPSARCYTATCSTYAGIKDIFHTEASLQFPV